MTDKAPVKSTGLKINKRFYIVLVCFLISGLFWLLIAMSHDYATTVVYPVKYVNFPGKKVVMNDLPNHIAVNVRASGFRIMSLGLNKEQKSVEVDVAGNMRTSSVLSDFLALPTSSFISDFSKELGKDVSITGFKPDSIVFSFSDLTTKMVPVVMSLNATFEKQFDSTGQVRLKPSEVEVSGPPSLVRLLESIHTEKVELSNLKTTVKGKVKLIPNRLLSYNVNEVQYVLPVEKFTEGSTDVEVHPINVKDGFVLKTFPDKIKVRYQVALSKYNEVEKSMFDATVNAIDIDNSKSNKLDVKLVTFPSFVKIAMLEPDKVDYILRKQ
jgi:hypothetical protein